MPGNFIEFDQGPPMLDRNKKPEEQIESLRNYIKGVMEQLRFELRRINGETRAMGTASKDASRNPDQYGYPIGSVYISTKNVSPALLFGGTWVRLQDRFLLAAGEDYEAGDEGGEAEVTLTADQSGVPAHGHPLTNPTVTNGGGHTHTLTTRYTGTKVDQSTGSTLNHVTTASSYSTNTNMVRTESSDGTHSHTLTGGAVENNTAADASEAHNNMPPYLVVYMWERTE